MSSVSWLLRYPAPYRRFFVTLGYPADYSVQVYVDASLVLQGRFEPLKQPYK